ncbi:hypothetical protein GGX14DRAFT_701587 [Mycena pura]|uniref:Transmembrane protein n=1 Tax=Mycena pura TaxID=153505 RepID=A0AAD6UP48_9AGAR|nr:hypothetical protein GGX14DRAFT_701587 [Mycena pura]
MVRTNVIRSLLCILWVFFSTVYAGFIPATIGSSSIVYPTHIHSNHISLLSLSCAPVRRGIAPTTQPDSTSPPRSTLVALLDTPAFVATLVVAIIALTALGALLCLVYRSYRTRRAWARTQNPPPPEAYRTSDDGSRRQLSITKVVISPLGSPSPSPAAIRPPSPVFSESSRYSNMSEFLSSDFDHIQRELRRGLSFVPTQTEPSTRPASRSSLGTTRTGGTVTRNNSAATVDAQRQRERGRRHGVLWDVDTGGWRRYVRDAVDATGAAGTAETRREGEATQGSSRSSVATTSPRSGERTRVPSRGSLGTLTMASSPGDLTPARTPSRASVGTMKTHSSMRSVKRNAAAPAGSPRKLSQKSQALWDVEAQRWLIFNLRDVLDASGADNRSM